MKLWDLLQCENMGTSCWQVVYNFKWDASSLYHISSRTSISYYVWAFMIRKIINWTIRSRSFVDIAPGCLYQKMQAQSRECNSIYTYENSLNEKWKKLKRYSSTHLAQFKVCMFVYYIQSWKKFHKMHKLIWKQKKISKIRFKISSSLM